MSYVRIWIHAVWATKNRVACLDTAIMSSLCDHIRSNARDKGLFVDTINGHLDHLHVLMLLKPEFSVAKQMQLIKGESSKWASDTRLLPSDFAWESQYYASSISGRSVPTVRKYIKNQQAHHASVTFATEFDHLVNSAGYSIDLPSGDELLG